MEDFDPSNTLGKMSRQEIGEYLQEIEDFDGAAAFMQGGIQAQAFGFIDRAYTHTGMIVGFIAPDQKAREFNVIPVGDIQADARLIGRRVKIGLDKFYVHAYPGSGKHTIVCEFAGKNQVAGEVEELRFALRFEANDKSAASISGVPIFLGLTVGANGISFVGKTVNVCSDIDEVILDAIDSPAFKNGLSLIAIAQPALKPLSGLASAAVKAVASRRKNKEIHVFNLGLDFSGTVTSARLKLGTYVVVQSDDKSWNWADFYWDASTQNLKARKDHKVPAANYMAFSVNEYAN